MTDFLISMLRKYLNPILRAEPVFMITGAGIVLGILNKLRAAGAVPAKFGSGFDLLLAVIGMFATRALVRPAGVEIPEPKAAPTLAGRSGR